MLRFSELVLAISVLTASLRLNSFVWILVVLVKRKIHIQFLCNMDGLNQAYIVESLHKATFFNKSKQKKN